MDYYSDKAKDQTVMKILTFYYRISEREWSSIKIGLVLIPLIFLYFVSFFIKTNTILIIFAINLFSILALIYTFFILIEILNKETGNERMMEIADAIREGSEGFFMTQYSTISKLSIVFGLALFLFYLGREVTPDKIMMDILGTTGISLFIVFSFCMGALCSGISGYTGMWVSVRANIRVAAAAMKCYNEALRICFNGGLFAAIINVALAIFGISSLFLSVYFYIWLTDSNLMEIPYEKIPLLLVGYGFGASFVAMFAQLGGGIYTKAADVGADLIGKIEMGIDEDDARNPAVIADLVGDNVGDCAGQAADLFESISAEIISAMILGCALAEKLNFDSGTYKGGFIIFPLIIHCLDIMVSIIGARFVRTKSGLPVGGTDYQDVEDPLNVMKKGYKVTVLLGCIGIIASCYLLLNVPSFGTSTRGKSEYAWIYFTACAFIGLIDSYLFIIITQIYTDYNYPSVKSIAISSQTGHATNIISGLSVGLESTTLPSLLIAVSLIGSYSLGQRACIVDDNYSYLSGLYGTAVATMEMFVSGVFILSMSGFGPIADNAGGIVEMSIHDPSVRMITDKLDAVGNVTKANTKGYSVGSASLACFLLFSAYMDEISLINGSDFKIVDIAQIEIFVSGFLGSAVVFLFSSLALSAVGIAAQSVIKEVRNQIKSDVNILMGKSKPNYKQCVAIVTKAGLKEMIKPGLLSVLSPLLVGVIFKYLGHFRKKPLLGAQCVASFLMFSTTTGILMALFFNNSGGSLG